MKFRKSVAYSILLLVGVVLGFIAAWIIQVKGEESIAKANIFAGGEALRSGDLVTSMMHAQAIIVYAPQAYDGYEFVGDVYSKQGYTLGAIRMYKLALERLEADGTDALLIQKDQVSVSTAIELLHRKIASLRP